MSYVYSSVWYITDRGAGATVGMLIILPPKGHGNWEHSTRKKIELELRQTSRCPRMSSSPGALFHFRLAQITIFNYLLLSEERRLLIHRLHLTFFSVAGQCVASERASKTPYEHLDGLHLVSEFFFLCCKTVRKLPDTLTAHFMPFSDVLYGGTLSAKPATEMRFSSAVQRSAIINFTLQLCCVCECMV